MMATQMRCARRRRGFWRLAFAVLLNTACGVTDEGELPPNVQDPAIIKTATGAMNYYRGTLTRLPGLLEAVIYPIAMLTDEFVALPTALGQSGRYTDFDSRLALHEGFSPLVIKGFSLINIYSVPHRLRADARQVRGFLASYAPESSPALRGHMYALEAYAEIFLADLFCSGIPLSTVDFEVDYTLTAGFTTTEVYTHAAGLFDSALALTGDSARFQHLAAVGRGRALLALGQYAAAAAAVAAVPDGFAYQVSSGGLSSTFLSNLSYSTSDEVGQPSMADLEGINGFDYRSSGDPRTRADSTSAGTGTSTNNPRKDFRGNVVYFPDKYTPANGAFNYLLASGIEARLIEAEAVLQAGGGAWLTTLNALRTDGTFDTQPNPVDPTQTDTLWHAGSGGVAGLRPLDDPGSIDARVNLVFRERAFWLFVTGQRQGDMRRLVRNYLRAPETVYPTGFYSGGGGFYGTEIVVPVPDEERISNPRYPGCFHGNA